MEHMGLPADQVEALRRIIQDIADSSGLSYAEARRELLCIVGTLPEEN
jgi:hypothetical protein